MARQPLPVLALGFRPFFLAAGVWAVVSVALWLAMLSGTLPMNRYYAGTTWHGHEMLFGYALAAIAGFLLTATRNWTGQSTATGFELGVLVGLWLAGRLAPFLPLPGVLVAALDTSFPILLAVSLYKALWLSRNRANRLFVWLLCGMGLASLLVQFEALETNAHTALAGDRLMLGLILLTLLVVAGRIMPFFTRTAIVGAAPECEPSGFHRHVERLTFAFGVLWVAMDVVSQVGWSYPLLIRRLAGVIALGLALILTLRLHGWYDKRVWGIPILAVLYCGYIWLILGLILNGLAHLGLAAVFPSLHALTIGAIGVFTLGMMGRVTQGHTGRVVSASRISVTGYLCLNLAAVVRVFGPLSWPSGYRLWVVIAGVLWVLAFAIFLWVHAPMLLSPRADGRPG